MDSVREVFTKVISQSETVLNAGLDNIWISTAIKVFLGLYAAFAVPQLSPTLLNLFDNVLVRVIVAFVIVFIALKDPTIAIMIAIAFVITLQTANKLRLINTDLSVSLPGESSWLPSAKFQEVPVLPHHEKPSQDDIEIMKASELTHNLSEQIIEPMPSDPADLLNNNTAFTSQVQFLDAQDNRVPGSDQMSCVQTVANQHCIQGIQKDIPIGNGHAGYAPF
jgi:hypothetical protein